MRALARIDLAAIERNCALLARVAAPAALCAVVKADGYGHGAAQAARAAQAGGAAWLAVATAGEAAGLRAEGIAGPLLVMGALSDDELSVALRARADVDGLARGVRRRPGRASRRRRRRRAREARHRAWAGSARATRPRRRASPPPSPRRRGCGWSAR